MGQYYKGNKIGTCESMYYMRLEQAQKLESQGQSDDDGILFSEYLTDNVTRFRFPFPNEDGLSQEELLNITDYSPSFEIPAGCLEDVGHSDKCYSSQNESGKRNVNMFVPCIHSEEFKKLGIQLSSGGAGEQFLSVKMQGMRDGEEKTIFACSRCGAQQRFSDDDIVKLKAHATKAFRCYDMTGKNPEYEGNQELYEEAMEIIKRIK